MSIWYFQSITLDSKFNKDIIFHIIQKGITFGFKYNTDFALNVSADEGANYILEDNAERLKQLYTWYKDISFELQFLGDLNHPLTIILHPPYGDWTINSDNRMVDNSRYLRLMLKLVEDLPLISCSIDSDHYDIDKPSTRNTIAINCNISPKHLDNKNLVRFFNNLSLHNYKITNSLDPKKESLAESSIDISKPEQINWIISAELYLIELNLFDDILYCKAIEPYKEKAIDGKISIDVEFYVTTALNITRGFWVIALECNFDEV